VDKTAPTLELRDIHLPADPSIWPLAIGWWIAIILIGIFAYFVVKKLIEIKNNKRLNVLMQQQLMVINNDYKKHNNKHQLAIEVSELLKRFVRHVLNDSHSTALTGEDWIEYLNDKAGTSVFNAFSNDMTQAQYLPTIEFDVPALMTTVKNYFPKAIKLRSKNIKGQKHA